MIENKDLISLTADIVSAHVSNNMVPASDIPALINAVHGAFTALGEDRMPVAEELRPAVSVRASVKPDHLVCLEDGKKMPMLKRYLRTNYNMSPEDYRAKWSLPWDYPMVAPNYTAQRQEMAKKIGLGRKAVEPQSLKTKPAAKARASKKSGPAKRAAKPAANAVVPASSEPIPQPKRRGRPKMATKA